MVVLVVAAMLITAAPLTMSNITTAASYTKLDERLSQIDDQQLLSAFEGLKTNTPNKEWLQNIDEQQLLSAFEGLKANGFDRELLSGGSDTMQTAGYGGGFVLILVLFILLVISRLRWRFILLVIIGAGFGRGGGKQEKLTYLFS